jgi:fumarate hydratase class I
MWLEHTETDPLSVDGLAEAIAWGEQKTGKKIEINLDVGIEAVRAALSGLEPGTPVLLSGNILVARDAAHARWKNLVDSGAPLPDYATAYPILYAGPAQTPPGCVTGSFGPTTAGRMDDYAELLMKRGAALVTVAKGNRSEAWRAACEKYGSTYLGTVGGAAALIAEECITASRILDYADLGMEAVRLVTLRDLPAFVLVNDKGQDFYKIIQEKTV